LVQVKHGFLNTVRHPLVIALAQRKWNGRVYKLDHVVENSILLYECIRKDLEFLERDKVILVPFDYSLQEEQGVRYYKKILEKLGIKQNPAFNVPISNGRDIAYLDDLLSAKTGREMLKALEEKFEARLNTFGFSVNEATLKSGVKIPCDERPEYKRWSEALFLPTY